MRVIVISDNHGNWDLVLRVLKKEPHDFAIHLGDADVIEGVVKASFDRYVGGNHDIGFSKYEDVFELEGLKVAITHGHIYGLTSFFSKKNATQEWARGLGVDLLLHGHAHVPIDDHGSPMRMMCPGSLTQPRSTEGATYLVLEIAKGKILKVKFKHP